MKISEFYKFLVNNPDLFPIMLGMDSNQFHELLTVFEKNKFGDRTQKTTLEKVIGVLLIKRFQLDNKTIKKIILCISENRTLTTFKIRVFERFKKVVEVLPEPLKSTVLNATVPVILSSKFVSYQYANLQELVEMAKLSLSPSSFVTRQMPETNKNWLDRYLKRPVIIKRKSGQDNFLQLLNCSLFDLEEFPSDNEYIIWYTAIIMNLFVHNSSHIPKPGFGKVQNREIDHLNYYFRSQNNHPHIRFFKALTSDNKSIQCIGPNNEPLRHIIEVSINNKFTQKINKYNRLGYVNQGESTASYFSASFAHSGLRRNNFSIYIIAFEEYLKNNSIEQLIEKLQSENFFSSLFKKQITKCRPTVLKARIDHLHECFYQYQKNIKHLTMHPKLLIEITEMRINYSLFIATQCAQKNFCNIQVSHEKNNTCLFVKFYPNSTYPENENYKTGVTNIIIGFFGGLLNHHCECRGLFIHTERRQSFGFYRPTLTDVGNMRMRISLGLEPECYSTVVIKSLSDLDKLLGKYNFTDINDANLKKGFEIVEKSQSKKGNTENTGIRFRKAMRSETRTHMALAYAQRYLNKDINTKHYKSKAFKRYIDKVCGDSFLAISANSVKNVKILPAPISLKKTDKEINPKDKAILKLLHNLIVYAGNFINDDIINIDKKLFAYSYWHVMVKLYRYCLKGQAILLNQDRYPATHIYAQSALLIDHILEYLIIIDGIRLIQKRSLGQVDDPINKLVNTEKIYTAEELNLQVNHINVFFVDSGQQANVVSIFTIAQQIYQRDNLNDSLYIYPKFYYELSKFIGEDLEITICDDPDSAKIILLDITEIDAITKTIDSYHEKVLIIDVTNFPCLSNINLKKLISILLKNSNYVLLTNSMLKHEQLNLDKYQVGKITILSPQGKLLDANIVDEFEQISRNAIHPVVASFLNIVNEVCQEKQASVLHLNNEKLEQTEKKLNHTDLISNFFASRYRDMKKLPETAPIDIKNEINEFTSHIMSYVNNKS